MPFPVIDTTILEHIETFSVSQSLLEFSFIICTIWPIVSALPLSLVHTELARILSAVVPVVDTISMPLVLIVVSLKDVLVAKDGFSLSIPLAMAPFT
jgi:hypothetical protein